MFSTIVLFYINHRDRKIYNMRNQTEKNIDNWIKISSTSVSIFS